MSEWLCSLVGIEVVEVVSLYRYLIEYVFG